MRLAVTGTGGIALQSIIPAIMAASHEFVGFQSRNPDSTRAKASAKGLQITQPGFATIEALYDQLKPDGVVIVGPSGEHAGHAVFFAERGVHSLIEKPVGITHQQIKSLFDVAAKRHGRVGGILQKALANDFQLLLRAMREGRFGEKVTIQLLVPWFRKPDYYGIDTYGKATSWKGTLAMDGGGAGMNQGIHHWDMGLRLLAAKLGLPLGASPFDSLQARKANFLYPQIECEDTLQIEAVAVDGTVVKFYSTTAGLEQSVQTPVMPDFELELCRISVGNATVSVSGNNGRVILVENGHTHWHFTDSKDYDSEVNAGQSSASQSTAVDPLALGFAAHQRVIEDFFSNRNPDAWRLKTTALAPSTLIDAYRSAGNASEIIAPWGLDEMDDGI